MDLLTSAEAEKILGLRRGTLGSWRCRKRGPAFVRVEGSVKYDRKDLEDYVRANRVVPGESAQGGK